MTKQNFIGRIIESDVAQFKFTCLQNALDQIRLGILVKVFIPNGAWVYAVVTNISWSMDALVNQIAGAEEIPAAISKDSIWSRIYGPNISCAVVGYELDGKFHHALPGLSILSLSAIELCPPLDARSFTGHSFVYLRLLLEAYAGDPIVSEILSSHLAYGEDLHTQVGISTWTEWAILYLVSLLDSDLMLLASIIESYEQRIKPPSRTNLETGGML
jgi:hypothetical protein